MFIKLSHPEYCYLFHYFCTSDQIKFSGILIIKVMYLKKGLGIDHCNKK